MDVYKNRWILSENVRWKVTLNNEEIKNYEARKWDVFFTRTSETVEEVGYSSVLLEDIEKATFSGFVLRGRPKTNELVPEYEKYCFSTRAFRKDIIASSTYTTRALTNWTSLSKIKIVVPKEPEQSTIAQALSDTDTLISSLDELIEKKKSIKQGTMQELLTGKRRLRGFSGDWEEKKVSETWLVITWSTPPTWIREYWNGNIPWITPTDISEKKDMLTSERSITELGLGVIRELPENTLLVTCIASIWKNAILRTKGSCNQQINAIIPNPIFDVEFLYYLMENSKNYLLWKAWITATLMISKKDFSEITFFFPDSKIEQTAIAKVISDMDTEISELEKKRDKYKQIKQGMMSELLTGNIRLLWVK